MIKKKKERERYQNTTTVSLATKINNISSKEQYFTQIV